MPSAEFDLIQQYFSHDYPQRTDVVLSVGDDAALCNVPAGQQLAISVDTLVAGVHFPLETAAEAIGHKALAVNLSDMAAMGAQPAWMTLALTCPHIEPKWLQGFAHGLRQLATAANVSLIGGDTTRGNLTITIQIMGLVPAGQALTRSGAQVGDGIYVTGSLGDAGLGLAIVQGRATAAQADWLTRRLSHPSPRWQAGRALLGIANSAIDISDGLAADLGHILTASGVGATLIVDDLPLSTAMQAAVTQEQAWQYALTAGDDYELCFTVPAAAQALLPDLLSPAARYSHIGTIETMTGLRCVRRDGSAFSLTQTGYQHFVN